MIPGMEKYLRDTEEETKPWDDPLVIRANEEVSIVSVLNDHYYGGDRPIPDPCPGMKFYCPMAYEHKDGGRDRQFRVYSDSNTAWCFAIHGFLTPVRLYRIRIGAPTLQDAAEDLLKAYGIRIKEPSYQERFDMTRAASMARARVTPDALIEALEVYLSNLPNYRLRQFDEDVLLSVNSALEEARSFCDHDPTLEEARQWLRTTQGRLSGLMTTPR